MKAILFAAAATALVCGSAMAQDEDGRPLQYNMGGLSGPTYAQSLEAAQTALNTCKAAGDNVGVAVVDATGGLRVVLGADGALAADSNGARRAALFASANKADGTELMARMKTDKAFADKVNANKDWNAHEGVLLIRSGDKVLGAIGVEGHPHNAKQELICAQAGIDKIKGQLAQK